MKFTAYNPVTGETLYSGTADNPAALVSADVAVHVGEEAPPNSYRAAGTWHVIPERPSQHHVWDWGTKSWTDPRTTDEIAEQKWGVIRARRDALLAQSDWRAVLAMESGEPLSPQWREYRQALRDITQQPDPDNVVWPESPEA